MGPFSISTNWRAGKRVSSSGKKLSLEFLGSGTSVGVPVIGCDCAVCQSTDSRNQRLRSSALVRAYDDSGAVTTTVVIDTSPDFRQQMLRSKVRRVDALVFTHYHADHVVGIDDIRRFNHIQNAVIDCWADARTTASLKRSFDYIFTDDAVPRWGLPCLKSRLIDAAFQIGDLNFEPIELDHFTMPTLGFKISSRGSAVLAYCLDVKRIPEESMTRLKGTHTLVIDMLREKIHPTHMNLDEALAASSAIGAERTLFGHVAHEVDHAEMEARLAESVRLAYDGLVIEMS